jgi:hypothetical protein
MRTFTSSETLRVGITCSLSLFGNYSATSVAVPPLFLGTDRYSADKEVNHRDLMQTSIEPEAMLE